ncbi:cytochrome P450 [Streptomyces sp. GXMU-J5]|uniref:Cytochrome P450 n=1 Tax=Streptomyces beihaiensis TaxID=2984495 RepID=A0ABT3TWV0_9ACTN|nr:cytochrome P450 [Streptomyces beihaiensis]MCX3061526.1 cytochrome P450 [Streptomyces beihaiensis]
MTAPTTAACPFDFNQALEFDPTMAELAARGPVTRIRLPYGEAEAWLVTSYDGVRRVTTDARFSRAAIVGRDYPRLTPEPIVSPESINVLDPPRSNRMRHVASQAFTRQRVERMRPAIDRVVAELLDEMASHGPPADLVRHLSDPLPMHAISELLGVPAADRAELRGYTTRMLNTSAAKRDQAAEAKARLRSYFADLIAERRRAPGDDLLSTMAAERTPDGDPFLNDDELSVLAVTLILSGNDTATCQISNITYTLLTRPDLLAALTRAPERLPRALDELLRHIPFRKGVGIPRIALEDVELEGTLIREGDYVHVSYLTANRDPAAFAEPDEVDLDRASPSHMTFGWGGHHCVASRLASAELAGAIGSLLTRFPGLRLAVPPEEIRWDTETIRRFPIALPVAW